MWDSRFDVQTSPYSKNDWWDAKDIGHNDALFIVIRSKVFTGSAQNAHIWIKENIWLRNEYPVDMTGHSIQREGLSDSSIWKKKSVSN